MKKSIFPMLGTQSSKIGNIGEHFVKLYYFIKGYEVGDGQPGGFFDVWYADKKTGIVKGVQVKTSRIRNQRSGLYYKFGLSGSKGIGRKRQQISPCDYVLVAISDNGNVRFIFCLYKEIKEMNSNDYFVTARDMHQIKSDFEISQELAKEIYKQDFDEDFEDVEIDLTPSQGLLFCMDKQ